MARLKYIAFIIVLSTLSAFTYGGLYSISPVANQDTYDYRPPVSPTAVSGPCSVRQDTQKHPATIPFRYYKRYMEESHTAIALPSLFTGCKPVCILVQRVFFIPPGIRVIAGISRSCSSRGPPCPAV